MKRPLTKEELAEADALGYDVSGYDGRPVDIPDEPTGSRTSPIAAGARAAAASAIPTAAGGAVFMPAFTAGTALSAPLGPFAPVGGVIAGLGAGYAASRLAGAGQHALMPKAWEQQLAEDVQQHPTATTVGQLSTLPLGGLRPSVGMTKNAVSGLTRLAVGAPLAAEEKLALKLAAGGAALGAGQEAVIQQMEGRPFDPKDIALSGAVGATFNKPTQFAQKYYKFPDVTPRTITRPSAMTMMQTATGQQTIERPTVGGLLLGDELSRVAPKPAETSAANILSAEAAKQPITPRAELGKTPLQVEVGKGLQKKGISEFPTPEYVDTLTSELLNQQNIKVSQNGSLTDSKGKPVRGTALLGNEVREVVTNPTRARVDNLPHEGLHYFRTELEQAAAAGNKKAQQQLAQLDRLSEAGWKENNALRVEQGKEPIDLHEYTVSEQGLEFVKQQFNLLDETPFKRWWNDTAAILRSNWDKNATLDDVRRAINFKFVNEQTMGKYVGKEGPLGKVGEKGLAGRFTARNEPEDELKDKARELARSKGLYLDFVSRDSGKIDAFVSDENGDLVRDIPKDLQSKLDEINTGYLKRNQPDDESLQRDITEYNTVQQQMSDAIAKEDFNTVKQLWKRNEEIKNKYGGMPPKERNQPEEQLPPWPSDKKLPFKEQKAFEKEITKYPQEGGVRAPFGGKYNVNAQLWEFGGKENAALWEILKNKFTPAQRESFWKTVKGEWTKSDLDARLEYEGWNETDRNLVNRFVDTVSQQMTQQKSVRNQPLSDEDKNALYRQGGEERVPYIFNRKEFEKMHAGAYARVKELIDEHNKLVDEQNDTGIPADTDRIEEIDRELEAIRQMRHADIEERQRNQPDEDTPIGKPVGAELVLLNAAKKTEIYRKWLARRAGVKEPVDDQSFFEEIMTNDAMSKDLMTEPNVIEALQDMAKPPPEKTLKHRERKIETPPTAATATEQQLKEYRTAGQKRQKKEEEITLPPYYKSKITPTGPVEAQPEVKPTLWDTTVKQLWEQADAVKSKEEAQRLAALLDKDYLEMQSAKNATGHENLRDAIANKAASNRMVRSDLESRWGVKPREMGKFQPDEGLSDEEYNQRRDVLYNKSTELQKELNRLEDIRNKVYEDLGLMDKIDTLAIKMYGIPEKDSGWTGADELHFALHNVMRPYDVENAELNLALSMPGLRATGVSEHAQHTWGKVKDRFPEEASEIEALYHRYKNSAAFKNYEVASNEQTKLFDQLSKLSKDKYRYQPDEEIDTLINTTDPTKQGFFRAMSSTADKVRPFSVPLSNAFKRWEAAKDVYWGHAQTAIKDLENFNPADVARVREKHREAFRTKTEPTFTGKEGEISRILTKYYHDQIGQERRDLGLKIKGREAGLNKWYVDDSLNDNTIALFTKQPASPEALHAKRVWAEYVTRESEGKISFDDALKHINNYIEAMGSTDNNYLSVNFGAIRKVEGYGLPEGLRETDAIKSLYKYGRRAAADLAMFRELESKPEIASRLKLYNPNTGKIPHTDDPTPYSQIKEVRDAMGWVTGRITSKMAQQMPKTSAFVRLVNNLLLGPATQARNIVQMGVNMAPYINRFEDLSAALKGIANLSEHSRAALETAARQPQIDRVVFDQIAESPNRAASLLRKFATLARKYQGAELAENFSRNVTFSIGKELALSNIAGARAGSKAAKQFLDKFGLLVDKDPTTLTGAELEKATNQMAKNFTDRNQGTYGMRGLPAGIVDSQFAPFFSLQKWGIEKSNVIYQDVVKPFMDGSNRLPMLTYLFGTVLTGAAIQQLNEILTNRKGQDPKWQEALDQPTAHNIVSELVTLMQLASFAGIIGDGAKTVSDISHGKTPRNIVSFPTATAALDLEEKTTDMIEAINQGDNPWEVMKAYTLDLLNHNVQSARMILNRTVKEENIERTDKFRDLRVFNELQGKPAGNITKSNPYLGMEGREYKQTGDLARAVTGLPQLLGQVVDTASGDYENLHRKMQSLRGNSYQIMPDFETMPTSFQRYYQFLVDTQGKEVADARMADYVKQKTVNRIKTSLVPRL